MPSVTVVKESKNYLIIKLPKKIAVGLGYSREKKITEKDVLALSREAIKMHRENRLPVLRSLRNFR